MVLRPTEVWSAITVTNPIVGDSDLLCFEDISILNQSFASSINNSPSSSPTSSRASIRTVEVVDFMIPWHVVPGHIMQTCHNGEKLSAPAYNQFVAIIVDKAREVDRYTTKKTFSARAKAIVDKFPKTFMDDDEDGSIIGGGNCSLLMKLIHRNNYKNRPHKSSFAQQI